MEHLIFEVVHTNTALREQLMRDARRARSEALHQHLVTLFKVIFGKWRRAPVHAIVAARPDAERESIALAA